MIGSEHVARVIGQNVYDVSGERIGSASEVYLDDETGQPEWVTVRTGLFDTKESFIPIREADLTNDGLRVPVSKEQVKEAPRIDTQGHLSPEEEQELYRYYGLGISGSGTETGTATEVTLHAERPDVANEAVPVERVRLDRETVTQQALVNEKVRKEEVKVDEADTDFTPPGPGDPGKDYRI
jgi:sporulation protein YlmC with PRC-barrel domain